MDIKKIRKSKIFVWGSLFNYRHPGPRRVWKVGSELQSTTLDNRDPVDPVPCPKVWFRLRETILFALWPAPDRPRPPPSAASLGRPPRIDINWYQLIYFLEKYCSEPYVYRTEIVIRARWAPGWIRLEKWVQNWTLKPQGSILVGWMELLTYYLSKYFSPCTQQTICMLWTSYVCSGHHGKFWKVWSVHDGHLG